MEVANMSANEWANAIARSMAKNVDEIPEGFYTTRQISKMTGRGLSSTKEIVERLVREGTAERKTFRVQTTSKQCPIPHYKIIK
jgi:transposase